MWVVADTLAADRAHDELEFFLDATGYPIFEFPDWETLPYDRYSPYHDIVSTRLDTLARLSTTTHGILVVPIATLMHRLPPVEFHRRQTVSTCTAVSNWTGNHLGNGWASPDIVMSRK